MGSLYLDIYLVLLQHQHCATSFLSNYESQLILMWFLTAKVSSSTNYQINLLVCLSSLLKFIC